MFNERGDAEFWGLRFPAFWAFSFFESGIGVLAAILLYFFPPRQAFHWRVDLWQIIWVTTPLLVLAWGATSRYALRIGPLREIYSVVRQSFLGKFIENGSALSFLFVSLAAGVGEELLFRAWVQPWIGWIGASVVFGLLHALTFGYFILATVIGLYLGYAFQALENGIIPLIVAHTLYDFLALLLYRRRIQQDRD